MALYEIPLLDRNQKFFIKLNKVNYQLKLVYIKRWYLDIYQANAELIACGIPLVSGIDILSPYSHLINGSMYVQNLNEDESQSFNDLGTNIKLFWQDPE
ncbi:phage baseplate plug family protein [Acinetobacter baumannii]|uniref:phage baseplate plug family protein n=1 Tax=Acinetobacter baumannii TaxID=470 RepID=UPI003A972424